MKMLCLANNVAKARPQLRPLTLSSTHLQSGIVRLVADPPHETALTGVVSVLLYAVLARSLSR